MMQVHKDDNKASDDEEPVLNPVKPNAVKTVKTRYVYAGKGEPMPYNPGGHKDVEQCADQQQPEHIAQARKKVEPHPEAVKAAEEWFGATTVFEDSRDSLCNIIDAAIRRACLKSDEAWDRGYKAGQLDQRKACCLLSDAAYNAVVATTTRTPVPPS